MAVLASWIVLLASGDNSLAEPLSLGPRVLSRPATRGHDAAKSMMLAVAHAGARLVSVGAGGVVLLSDDHGAFWRQAEAVPVSVLLTSVHFVSASEGWATGHLGTILHSTDAGEHWIRQMDGVTAAGVIASAVVDMPAGPARDQAQQSADRLVADGPDKPFFDLWAKDREGAGTAKDLVAVGAFGLALSSHDGGTSWHSAAEDVPDPKALHLYRMAVSASGAYVVGEQGIVLASDGGARFKPERTPYDGSFFGAALSPAGTILAFGLKGRLFRSDDRGVGWHEIRTSLADAITCGIALHDGRMLLGSQGGELIASSDDGRSFRRVGRASPNPIMGLIEDGSGIVIVGPGGPLRLPASELNVGS